MEFTRTKCITLWAADKNNDESRTFEIHDDKVFNLYDKDNPRSRSIAWLALSHIRTQLEIKTILIFYKERDEVIVKINNQRIAPGSIIQIKQNQAEIVFQFPNKSERHYSINWKEVDEMLEWTQNNTGI